MQFPIFAFGVAASLAFAAPAVAFDSSGTSHFDTRFGKLTSTFQQSYNPADGVFSRTGQVTLSGGRTLTYALSATCAKPQASCDFTGNAEGPFGGKWHAIGQRTREADGVQLVGELTEPDGKTIEFDHQVRGRGRFWQYPELRQDTRQN